MFIAMAISRWAACELTDELSLWVITVFILCSLGGLVLDLITVKFKGFPLYSPIINGKQLLNYLSVMSHHECSYTHCTRVSNILSVREF